MNKKELKKAVHEHGFFLSFPIHTDEALKNKYKAEAEVIPNDAFGWGGIASQEVLNMNGYGIRLKAWKPAIKNYLENNPIIFFGHEDNQALGQTLSAKVTKDALEVFGYVRRQADQQYAAGNIEAGIYRMLSTGHVTEDFEFENLKSKEVMSKDDFFTKINNEGYGDWLEDWYLWVTKLRFLEWSIVGIGAVQTAFKSNSAEDIWLNHFNSSKEDFMKKTIIANNDLEEVVATPENEGETPEVVVTEVVEGEQPEAIEEAPAEQAEPQEEVTEAEEVEPAEETVASTAILENSISEVRTIALLGGKEVLELKGRLDSIEQRLNSSANKKAIHTTYATNTPTQGKTLADLINN